MYQGHTVGAVILMGGSGKRFDSSSPKQFLFLGEKRVYQHTLDVFRESGFFDEIVLVCHPDWIDKLDESCVPGGKTRQTSSYLGLRGFSKAPDIVMIHDAVRPFVSKQILKENLQKAILHGAVDTCIPSADTIVYAPGQEAISDIPKRSDFLRGQTPQTFRYPLILDAHEKALSVGVTDASDDCQLVLNQGVKVVVSRGDDFNIKITNNFDFILAESILVNLTN